MDWLNYQHLYYFAAIVSEGGLAKAAKALRLTHSTLSVQLRALEVALGEPLFERRGRSLVLTPFGRDVHQYATEIFRLGTELLDFSRGRATELRRFDVGVVSTIPKTIVSRLLVPALDAELAGTVRIRQDAPARLVPELAAGRLHALLTDAPITHAGALRLHTHVLGSSDVWLYGTAALAARYRRGFPDSLRGAPLLLPAADAPLRRGLERWFADHGLRVDVAAEVEDAGILRALGAAGRGLFPVRAALRSEVEEGVGARRVGPLTGLVETYFIVSLERRIRHPSVVALIASARRRLESRADSADDSPKRSKAKPP
ncbi:MAG: LysR family transcriptional regulator [Kofleriaceae bacterium]